jgi:recombination protein RecA
VPHPLPARYLLSEAQLQDRLSRSYITTKVPDFDAALEGFPRGAITELTGPASSGRTSLVQSFLAAATTEGEYCALVDASNNFDPHSTAAAGADLTRLLWVRCGGNPEHAMQCTDRLIHAGGWGAVILDVGDMPAPVVRRVPISWWYRFRRAVENTPTAVLVVEREPFVRACASMALELPPARAVWSGTHPDFRVLRGTTVELKPKKPVRSAAPRFETRALA